MSKRGGASQINGFISINTDDKKSALNRKDNEKTTKTVRGETSSRHNRDPSREKSKNAKPSTSKHHSSKESSNPTAQRVRREELQVEKTIKVKETPSTQRIASKLKKEDTTPSPRLSKTLDPKKNKTGIKAKPQDSKLQSSSSLNRTTETLKQTKTRVNVGQILSPGIKTKTEKVLDATLQRKGSPGRRLLTKQSTFSLSDKKTSDLKSKYSTQSTSSTKNIHTSSPKSIQSSKVKADKSRTTKVNSTTSKVSSKYNEDIKGQHTDAYEYIASTSLSDQQRHDSVEESYDYEDDFEEYQSDFEEYTSSEDTTNSLSDEETEEETEPDDLITELNSQATDIDKDSKQSKVEEERKLDSGSYHLTNNGDLRRKKHIQEIKNAIDKENAAINSPADVSVSPEDEGFEDVQSRDSTPTFMEINSTKGLINFTNARNRQKELKAKEKVKHRGALLLDMIRLDVMNFNLFDLPPVPYEVYIKCYGRSNTQQMQSQTGEDNLSEEVQTDDISHSTKWTQHPVHFSSPNEMDHHTFVHTFSQERLGVGGEITMQESETCNPKLLINTLHLHNFINAAGEVMLILLEESEKESQKLHNVSHNKVDFGFSDGYTGLNVEHVPFLKDRLINLVSFSQSNYSQILTVHQPSPQPKNVRQESEGRCLLCVWSVLEPSSPQKILVASNNVTAVSFHSHLVFAGLIDGSLCVWDLREKGAYHQQSLLKQYDWLLRSPTYITAEVLKEKGHLSTVVSLQILPEASGKQEKSPTQIVTVDEEGILIVWTVIESICGMSSDMGLAHWGRVRLIPSSRLSVLDCFPRDERRTVQCQCLAVDLLKPSNLYIGTNTGQVIHCLQSSTKTRPQVYPSNTEEMSSITCLEFSKCGPSTLMVGDSEGRVRLYRTASENPILNLFATVTSPSPGVKSLQMSPCHPGLFFVLDTNSCLHVWDLCKGDLYPMFSVPFKDQAINTAQISPHINISQMALATTSGQVQIHHLKPELSQQPPEVQLKETTKFERYIDIL